jgi:hypothetical protein
LDTSLPGFSQSLDEPASNVRSKSSLSQKPGEKGPNVCSAHIDSHSCRRVGLVCQVSDMAISLHVNNETSASSLRTRTCYNVLSIPFRNTEMEKLVEHYFAQRSYTLIPAKISSDDVSHLDEIGRELAFLKGGL